MTDFCPRKSRISPFQIAKLIETREPGSRASSPGAALHEVPQELGDFGVLVHGGWPARRALLYNLLSGLMFLVGSLLAYLASFEFSVAFLVPFAAGNFIYIGASDLVPEVTRTRVHPRSFIHFLCFVLGLGLLYALRDLSGH